jgi:formylglycine-generating enzyme required for sulfatase activity
MPLASLVCNTLGTLLDSPVINFLGNLAGKPVFDVLKSHFKFTTLEITQAYQKSYIQVLNAIQLGLRSSSWKKLLTNNVKRAFANQLLKEYFKPFVESQEFSQQELNAFALKLSKECHILIKHKQQLFQLQDKDLELGLVEITNPHQSWRITELLIEEISNITELDQDIIAFFRYKELLGNGLLYFFHEQLRRDERLQNTFSALQQEGLWVDIRNVQKAQQQLTQIANQHQLQLKPPQILYQLQQLWQQQLGEFQDFSLQFKGFVEVVSNRLEFIAENINNLHLKTDRILELLHELKQKNILSDQQITALVTNIQLPKLTTLKSKPAIVQEIYLKEKIKLQTFNFNCIALDKFGKISSSTPSTAKQFIEKLGKGITLEMIYIPQGRFLMGATKDEFGFVENESPEHWVDIKEFFISKYPITQMQWFLVMKEVISCQFHGTNFPLETITWFQALAFCHKLSQKTGRIFRLPTEAEWEYACRAGTTTPFHFGETITTNVANYDGNYNFNTDLKSAYHQMTTPVGSFFPNAFGLFDMHGNVWEWTCSEYSEYYNNQLETKILKQQQALDKRIVVRGGSWYSSAVNCRSANRYHMSPNSWDNDVGFRVVVHTT